MDSKAQFIYDDAQQPLYAILPFAEYKRLLGEDQLAPQKPSLLSEDGRSIRLPNGGPGAAIDLPRFVDYWARSGLLSMPINQRAKRFDQFEKTELFSLEPFIRGCFLAKDSSYKNTMQVTTEVIAALVETKMFKEVRFDQAKLKEGQPFKRDEALVKEEDLHKYSRTVKCLEIVESEVVKFLKANPHKGPSINRYWFLDDCYKPAFLK
ncbi:hypothetical protein LOY27_09765 [Pseudomonas atacamensis]|jgi:hypothetical protein|uniref:hypothetical protein n=1 Tax=Pseudomonas atacamensis TaxID=2565368 RepID=UPI00215F0038|nr:hypothetical protein [Pseudomonas atacamensis]UVL16119.1 hypothetical protein LOY27_09765 [Pseudomonas atacamensis]